MKKFLLAIVMLASGFVANAQEKKNQGGFAKEDLFVSGSVGYNTVEDADIYTFSPSVGYFVSDNIALELGLTIGGSDDDVVETNAFGVSIGANYFFTPENNFSFVVGAGLSYVSTGSEIGGAEQADVNTFGVAIAPGINYFVSESIALRASIGALSYASSKADVDGAESVNSFGLNLNLSDINFGITYKF